MNSHWAKFWVTILFSHHWNVITVLFRNNNVTAIVLAEIESSNSQVALETGTKKGHSVIQCVTWETKNARSNLELNISVIQLTPISSLIRRDTEAWQATCRSGINKAPNINPKHQKRNSPLNWKQSTTGNETNRIICDTSFILAWLGCIPGILDQIVTKQYILRGSF